MTTPLIGEVKDGGGASAGGGDSAGLEVVAGNRRRQGQFHMRMHIDSAGENVFPLGIYRHVGLESGKHARRTNRCDFLVVDQDIAMKIVAGGDNMTICE